MSSKAFRLMLSVMALALAFMYPSTACVSESKPTAGMSRCGIPSRFSG